MMFNSNGFQFIFQLFPILFLIVFALTIGFLIFSFTKVAARNKTDQQAPRLSVEATAVSKRTHVWGDHSHTDYYVTFQFESGDRLELKVPSDQFGYIVEGDQGKLAFQGTRFMEFTRN